MHKKYTTAVEDAAQRVLALTEGADRILIGIVGAPGVGKSTFAGDVTRQLGQQAICVGMDGFHLANTVLTSLGRAHAKGAIDTFDAAGFVNLVHRLARAEEEITYAPEFRREIDESVAGAIPVPRSTRIVILEGNYLLVDADPWRAIPDLLTESWYLVVDEDIRLSRLQERHRRFGASPELAREKAFGNDQSNAQLIMGSRERADLIFQL